jgi:hypothetical protein
MHRARGIVAQHVIGEIAVVEATAAADEPCSRPAAVLP